MLCHPSNSTGRLGPIKDLRVRRLSSFLVRTLSRDPSLVDVAVVTDSHDFEQQLG
jgi:hypothetical protein